MKLRTLRGRIVSGAAIAMAVSAGLLAVSSGVASADPTLSHEVAPQFYSGNNSQIIRDSGSDTTFYMMQQIADLYNQAALYGCGVAGAASFPCPTSGTSDTATSDDVDNWDRNEVLGGIDDVGSGDGQKQLCQTEASPDPVDFSRSSKSLPSPLVCTGQTAIGYAYDGVPELDFAGVNPGVKYGALTHSVYASGPATGQPVPWYAAVDSAANLTANDGSALMGPVAAGWLPGNQVACPVSNTACVFEGAPPGGWVAGDATTCPTTVTACTLTWQGTPFTNITNNDHGGTANTGSVAYRLYCDTTVGSAPGDRVTDWGQITNLNRTLTDVVESGTQTITSASANFRQDEVGATVTGGGITGSTTIQTWNSATSVTLAATTGSVNPATITITDQVGDGTPIGIPTEIMGVNPASGTNFTIGSTFFASGQTTGDQCAPSNGSNNTNANANTIDGNTHTALENDAANLAQFAEADFPGDPADQAAEISTEFYYISEGVDFSNAYARQVTLYSTGNAGSGTATSFPATKMKENGIAASSLTEGNKTLPTSRGLWNMFVGVPTTVQAASSKRALTVTDASYGASSSTLSSVSAQFQTSDVGRDIGCATDNTGCGIPANDYITAVSPMLVNGTALPANTVELAQATTLDSTNGATPGSVLINSGTVGLRASTAGFLNWTCTTDGDGVGATKGTDNQTGKPIDNELSNIINTEFGFNRIVDDQTGSWAGLCTLIYPQGTDPYPATDGSGNPLATVELTGPFPFPWN